MIAGVVSLLEEVAVAAFDIIPPDAGPDIPYVSIE